MFKQFFIILLLWFPLCVSGQKGTQVILTAFDTGGHTVEINDKLCIKSETQEDKIKYTLDTVRGCLTTKKYRKYRCKGLYDKKVTKWENKSTTYVKWKNEISSDALIKFLSALKTNIDTLDVQEDVVVRSSGSFNFIIEIIQEGNKFRFVKQIPCTYASPWFKSGSWDGYILNPTIDEQLLMLLPKNFLAKEKLLVLPPVKLRCKDSCQALFYGKPVTITRDQLLEDPYLPTDSLDKLMMESYKISNYNQAEAAPYAIKVKGSKTAKHNLWVFRIHSKKEQKLTLKIYNLGELILQETFNVKEGRSYRAVDISDFHNYSFEYMVSTSKDREVKGTFKKR